MKNIDKFLYALKRRRKEVGKKSAARFRGNEKRETEYRHISLYRRT
jgi:hypothetical protein